MFLLNLFLMLAWVVLSGQYTLANLLWGFVLGYVVLWIMSRTRHEGGYFARLRKSLALAGFFIWELLRANVRLTYDILTPRHHMRPAIIAVPLELESDRALLLLSTLVTLTPGSLAIDVSEDRRVLFVHSMYVEDVEREIWAIKNGYERRVLEVSEG